MKKYLKSVRNLVKNFKKNLIHFGKEYWNVRELFTMFRRMFINLTKICLI